jgi:hypothetical protein
MLIGKYPGSGEWTSLKSKSPISNVTPAEAGKRIGELQQWLQQTTKDLEFERIAPDKSTMDAGTVLLVLAPFAAEMAGAFMYEVVKDGAKQITVPTREASLVAKPNR